MVIKFWLTSWVIWWRQICSPHFFTCLPVSLKLAYFAPLNGAGRFFPVNFNYPRCLENSNMIMFWLISWVIWWWHFIIFSSSSSLIFALDKGLSQQPLTNTRHKYFFDSPVTFFKTKCKILYIFWPHFCLYKFWMKRKKWLNKKNQFFWTEFFADFLEKKKWSYHYSPNTVTTFFCMNIIFTLT